MENIIRKLKEYKEIAIVGSHARKEENPKDIDVVTYKLPTIMDKLLLDTFRRVRFIRGNNSFRKYLINGHNVDIWFTSEENFDFYRIYRTIKKGHLIALKTKARNKQHKLTPHGLLNMNTMHLIDKWPMILKELNIKSKNIHNYLNP
jgi:DNA polymerase/3'-5' exonuclease PolX